MSQSGILNRALIPSGDAVQQLTGNTGGAVGPDASNNINIVGTGAISVAGNPGTNTLTISSSGSSNITITGDSGGGLTGNSFTFTGASTGLTFAGAGTTETLGGTLAIANGGTNATSFTQSNGIVTYNGTRLVNYAGPQINSSGQQTNTTQPAFLARLNSSVTNATGNGAVYQLGNTALTKVFDNDTNFNTNGTFTAPVTGRYSIGATVTVVNCTIASTLGITLLTTARSYLYVPSRAASSVNFYATITVLADMTAGDTWVTQVTVSGEAGNTDTIFGTATDVFTGMWGNLVC